MDPASLSPLPVPPHPGHPNKLVRAIFWALIVSGIVMGVYFFTSHGYLPFSTKNTLSPDLVFSVKTPDGSTWYEIPAPSKPTISYADLKGETIVGIVRAVGKIFVLAQGPKQAGTLYTYANNTYTKVYESANPLNELAISSDGKFAAFTEQTASGSEVDVLDLSTKKATTVASGSSPAFIFAYGANSLLYISGSYVMAAAQVASGWSHSVPVFTSIKPVPHIAANGSMFAVVDPVGGKVSLWKLTSFNPDVATVVSITKVAPVVTEPIAIINGEVVSYPAAYMLPTNITTVVVVVNRLSDLKIQPVRFTLPGSLHVVSINLLSS